MLWVSKRRKSRPEIPPATKQSVSSQAAANFARRSSLGSPRLPLSPLDMPDHQQQQNNILISRPILSPDEQRRVARQSPSPPPNFSYPRRDAGSSSPSTNSSDLYTTNTLSSFNFGLATQPPPSPGRSIGPLDEVDEDDMRRRAADETPRQSLASASTARPDPRTPAAFYSPPRSDAASHHTFGTSSASSLSSPSRSRTTSSTTHTSLSALDPNDLGGVTFNPQHHHPAHDGGIGVEFDSEEEEIEFSNDDDDHEMDMIEVSSARGGGSMEGAQFEAFERQMYRDSEAGSLATQRRPSLPMAIPGTSVSPDDILSMRREREGSLTTLRRPSRSLDDQVSVLGDNNNNAHAPNAPSMTTSVPESGGDWRSLSARASAQKESPTSINAPPVFTMPTFAPPVSAVNPSQHANNRGSISSGLDMNDIAVYSSSGPASTSSPWAYRASRESRRPSQLSLMLRRPSTASGGEQGWGGEEYERQRKYWTFRKDLADGRGGGTARAAPPSATSSTRGAALSPVRSITSGRGKGLERGTSILSGHGGHSEKDLMKRGGGSGSGRREPSVPWRGMSLNAEEIWNSSLVGSFKVRRIELRPQKPQQRVTIDPFRGPYTLGPKPPHDGAYTNIHKHSKVMAFSIHRHYKPTRAPPPGVDARGSFSAMAGRPSTATGTVSGNGQRGSVSTASGRTGYASAMEERRRPTAMILLAPRHVQVAYTSTNTTKGLRAHGLLDEGPDRDRERERTDNRDTRSTGRSETGREKEKGRQNGGKDKQKASSSKQQLSSTGSTASSTSTYRNEIVAPPPPPSVPSTHSYPPPTSAPFDGRDANFIGPTLAARSASSSRRRRRDSLDDDSDSDTERVPSRTTHNEAFSTLDASSIDQMALAQDARGEGSNGVLSRFVRRGPAHLTGPGGPAAPHQVYIPPWVTLQSRVKQEERRRRHDVLSNSFEDVGLLPPKKSTGGTRAKKAPVPSDALFMLLPLWPGPTDPVSERNATEQPHEIPTEQRQYLLVSYKPADERPPPSSKKHDKEEGRSKKGSSHSSPTSSGDRDTGKGCDILLTSYHISARLVSHADLQGSGVRVPDEGLAVLGPWREAWLTMPQIATRDHGLLVIGTCASRDAGIEFDPEGLLKMGLCIPALPDAGADELGLQEEPVAELTPIGKAVLEMAWIGCIAVTSFGPAGSS
ncbi:hypothetical protein MVEN_00824300 [Mycena venus]|uniref:Uncharacterized protein n=1 Tax=Mycena venus TaxID=2733690 RepID=A0A8H6YB50_9AGAR|nr:hypothetical protein MVEN_00824300 [Mycena venus]